MKLKICLLGLLCLFFKVDAWSNKVPIPLKIGDQMPDLTFENILNYSKSSFRISDFKGKAVLLDFWATYCTSCLTHFSLADSLQREYKNDLQILLVDGPYKTETKENILKTLSRFKYRGQNFSIPTVINDNVLISLFPHYTIPHYVWIDKNGTIRAITAGDDITRTNVTNFLNAGKIPEYEKNDFDPKLPLYTVKSLPTNLLEQFSILLKGKIEGIGNGGFREINDTVRGIILHNRSLLDMYERILPEIISCQSNNRMLIEVKDPSKLSFIPSANEKESDWERTNLYSYELIIPKNQMGHLFYFALDDLNKYTPYKAIVEKRKVFCWTLESKGNVEGIKTRGGTTIYALKDPEHPQLNNASIKGLLVYLNKISNDAIVVDQTGITQNIDLSFRSGVKDMATMSNYLKDYGLNLTSGYKDIDMLVIKDK
jgi:thiol-disulfide isomerase/thioredoxin